MFCFLVGVTSTFASLHTHDQEKGLWTRDYFCPVTFELLMDPRQTNFCCGNHLSRATAERLEGKPCPFCKKKTLKTTEDLFFKRKVMELKVRCNNKAIGCKWVEELGNLNDHLKLGSVDGLCDFVVVDCPLKCGERIQRRNLAQHKSNECSKRPFTCKYCDYSCRFNCLHDEGSV